MSRKIKTYDDFIALIMDDDNFRNQLRSGQIDAALKSVGLDATPARVAALKATNWDAFDAMAATFSSGSGGGNLGGT